MKKIAGYFVMLLSILTIGIGLYVSTFNPFDCIPLVIGGLFMFIFGVELKDK